MRSQFRLVSVLAACGLMLGLLPGEAMARRHRRARPGTADASGTSETVTEKAPQRVVSKSDCVAAFNVADASEKAGHLAEARQQWLKCARAVCGSFLKQECTSRYTQLEADIPSVVPVFTDESGAPRVDVQVQIDGEVVASQLDGRAVQVDPGLHEFTFSVEGNVISKQKLMIAQGQRNRQIVASLRPARKHAEPVAKSGDGDDEKREDKAVVRPIRTIKMEQRLAAKEESKKEEDAGDAAPTLTRTEEPAAPSHTLSYVLGGAGLASIGAGALMIYWGRKDNDLLSQCSPGCSPDQVNHIRRLYLAGDIAVGAGVASLAASYLVYKLTSHSAREEKATEEAYRLDVIPTSSGAVASVSGSF